ncbi:hypothetical protein HPC38_02980 [Pasteurellaceae bacterium HPA106]|uniref:PepSY domain-containing protein n=1 Tax=Spirabiliibacterium pneumoniae TaxID=221400 RepID=UPI001AACD0A5|nr:PepSY domain-containing protein [Spirabiliibacterium pneumoniae]MBE2895844.1 hypothetical protein [Spirabiliibacterium pneumoniae]
MSKNARQWMRTLHRYSGFSMLFVMLLYGVTGIVLGYRDTDIFRHEVHFVQTLDPHLDAEALGKAVKIKNLKIERQQGDVAYFKQGTYNVATGEADYKDMRYPRILDELINLHKANSKYAYSPLNIFFAIALIFFVVSAIWMIPTNTKGRKISLFLILFSLILVTVVVLTD